MFSIKVNINNVNLLHYHLYKIINLINTIKCLHVRWCHVNSTVIIKLHTRTYMKKVHRFNSLINWFKLRPDKQSSRLISRVSCHELRETRQPSGAQLMHIPPASLYLRVFSVCPPLAAVWIYTRDSWTVHTPRLLCTLVRTFAEFNRSRQRIS